MAWDFETDPEFARKPEWIESFVAAIRIHPHFERVGTAPGLRDPDFPDYSLSQLKAASPPFPG